MIPNRITLHNFDELLLEAREFIFANEEWVKNKSGRGVSFMEQIVHEFEVRFGIQFEPEPMTIDGEVL